MATTKYIVNNLNNQKIIGDLDIQGAFKVNGTAIYRALLTQTGSITANNLNDFNYGLIIGEEYTVITYQSNDDFSNIADVQLGGVNNFNYSWNSVPLIDASFTNVTGTTGVEGYGATFDVYITGGTATDIQLSSVGSSYLIGNTITISGTDVGGISPDNDILITVTSLTPNSTGSIFIATGQTPAYWDNSTVLTSDGGLIVDVLENTLGYDLNWEGLFGPGFYVAANNTTGPVYNSFPRDKVEIITSFKWPFADMFSLPPFITPFVGNFINQDDVIALSVIDVNGPGPGTSSDLLYYTPIEIKINQDTDTTPIEVYGEVITSFPFGFTQANIIANQNVVQTTYTVNTSTVNNISELVTLLNNDLNNVYGLVYSEEGIGGIKVVMPTNLKNQFCANGTLTFQVSGGA